jgi:hypothetical protein
VLKPVPAEARPTANVGPGLSAALRERIERLVYPAGYELFGTLSDEQIKRFLSTKKLRIPVKSMPKSQRKAIGVWFDAFIEAMKGGPPEYHDFRVILYKMGAKEDLSNVDAGFTAAAGHAVHLQFWVRQRDGTEQTVNSYFAEI